MNEWMNEWMMFLLTCDKKLTKSQLSPTHASTKRKITDELKHNAGWYEVREGSPFEKIFISPFCLEASRSWMDLR